MKSGQVFLASLLFTGSLAAQPQGFNLVAGTAGAPVLNGQGKMTVQSGSKTIVNWDSFSIAASEHVHFQQQGSSSAILNRVVGTQGSDLYGLLTSNGKVFLINPNGVFIGPGGRIETAGFLASTFDVLDADFLEGNDLLFSGDSGSTIQNLGTISCPAGNVRIFAAHIVNEGDIQAAQGKVSLLSGGDILLQKEGSTHIYIRPETAQAEMDGAAIDNKGTIQALAAYLQTGASPYAKAIRCSGKIDAIAVQEIGGKIYLVAEKGITEVDDGALTATGGTIHVLGEKVGLQNNSQIDVSALTGGGTILIGGDLQGQNPEIQNASLTYVSKESSIKADAFENGNGGKIIVWSDEATFAYGAISARGGQTSGDGGFVEVSGKYLDFQGSADRRAPQGTFGTLLLDPVNITISTVADSSVSFASNTYSYTGACPGGPTAIINNTNLVGHLNAGNVTISTSMSGATSCVSLGTITVSNDIGVTTPWTAATTLTMTANSNIAISAAIKNSNATTTPFSAMSFTANGTGSTTHGINVAAAGPLTCTGAGGITLAGTAGTGSSINGVNVAGAISSSTGTITLSGTGTPAGSLSSGVSVVAAISGGNINFSNCFGGTAATTANDNYGANIGTGGSCTAHNGTITFSNCVGGVGNGGTNNIGLNIILASQATVALSAQNIIATNNIVGGKGNNGQGCLLKTCTITSSTGNIEIAASSAVTVPSSNAAGIVIIDATIQAGGSGVIALNGTATNGIEGLAIEGTTLITSVNGNILLTGTQSGSAVFGIQFQSGPTVGITGTGSILVSSSEGIQLNSNSFTTANGNITFDGSLTLESTPLTIAAGGAGSISFSSTIDGAVPLTATAGGSITFSGNVGSATPLTSLTVQPGSGFFTSATLGTVPNGTITFGGSSVATTGAVSLNAAGRTVPMSVATIIGTGDLTITSGSLTMGINESMTVLGNCSIDGALTLSDIVAAGDLTLTGSSISLNPQPSTKYLSSTGSFYTSPSAHLMGLNLPVTNVAVTPAGARVIASGFFSESSFAKVLTFKGTVLNYDIHTNPAPPVVVAGVFQLGVAVAQLSSYPSLLLPPLDLRFFPVYAICSGHEYEDEPCETGVFVPFIFESDIVDGNLFRAL